MEGIMSGSETAQCRSVLAPYCVGMVLDIGFGGDAIVPHAVTLDLPRMYCPSFKGDRQTLRGDCQSMPFICDGAFDVVFSSHVIEDFYYDELIGLITEWRRILTPGGALVLNCPDQKRFVDHCARTGQSLNANHKELDFSLRHFADRVLPVTGLWDIVLEMPDVSPYSWYACYRKI